MNRRFARPAALAVAVTALCAGASEPSQLPSEAEAASLLSAEPDAGVLPEPDAGALLEPDAGVPAEPSAPAPALPAPTPAAFPDDGPEDIWRATCSMCHGRDGRAQTPNGRRFKLRDLTSPAWHAEMTDARIRQVITLGVVNTRMRAFETKMTPQQLDALVAWIRRLKLEKRKTLRSLRRRERSVLRAPLPGGRGRPVTRYTAS